MDDLSFSVLSLGDSSYEFFCETGKKIDQRLEELGAKRVTPRVDCDLDFDDPAAEWLSTVVKYLNETGESSSNLPQSLSSNSILSSSSTYSRRNPFKAEVLENINLNGRGFVVQIKKRDILNYQSKDLVLLLNQEIV